MKDVLYDVGYMNTFMSLNPDLNGENPDHYVSKVVYEKGFQLLYYMQSLIGKDNMRIFVRDVIRIHETNSIDTERLREAWM